MDFRLSKETERFREEVHQFMEKEWPKEFRNWRGWQEPCTPGFMEANRVFERKLAAKGLLGISFPKEYGGIGRSLEEQYVFHEELKLAFASIAQGAACGVLFGPTILRHGTEEQKKKFLSAIARGELTLSVGYSEPNAGSDLASLQLRAIREGDFYIINGSKMFTSHAHATNHVWLVARTDPEVPKHRGISVLVVDINTPGITIRPVWCMGDERTNEVFFDNVKVPVSNRIGEENKGWYYVSTALDLERLVVFSTTWVRKLFDELVAFLKTAEYGDWRPREDPDIRSKVAQFSAELEVCQALEYRMLWMLSVEKVPYAEASMLKVSATELYQRITDTFSQFLGLYGQLTQGSPQAPLDGGLIEQHESSIGATILAGTSEIQRNIIAIAGLGLPPR